MTRGRAIWAGRTPTASYRLPVRPPVIMQASHIEKEQAMRIIGWIVLIIFLIGLAVVLGLGKLIF